MSQIALIILSVFTFTGCSITYQIKTADVRKSLKKFDQQAGKMRRAFQTDYEKKKWVYKELRRDGAPKNEPPMPEIKSTLRTMKKQHKAAMAALEDSDLTKRQIQGQIKGKKRIKETDPRYKKIVNLREKLKGQIETMKVRIDAYSKTSNGLNDILKSNSIYFIKTDQIRSQTKKYETEMRKKSAEAKKSFSQWEGRKLPAKKRQLLNQAKEIWGQAESKVNEAIGLLKKLDKKLGQRKERVVSKFNDPQALMGKVQALGKEINAHGAELKQISKKFND